MPSTTLLMEAAAYTQWCRARALAPSTISYLSTLRGSDPARRVTSRANNVSGTYPSPKMGATIQFESQNPELWALVMMDCDPEVLEFFEQPDTFKIRYLDKSGKKMQGHSYTPDFLILRTTAVCFEEWKRESDLKRLAVNALAPAMIVGGETLLGNETQVHQYAAHIPVGRLGKPEEVAEAALSLIANPFLTGPDVAH